MTFLDKIFPAPKPTPKPEEPVRTKPQSSGPRLRPGAASARRTEGTEYYDVVCPYCMERYPVWDLQFRSVSVVLPSEGNGKGYPLERDDLYCEFWESVGMPAVDEERAHVLSVSNSQDVQAVQLWDKTWVPTSTPEQYRRIEHSAIMRVKDRFGGITRQRICPKCHNDLPDVIGCYPNYIFSLMGNTSCGKTWYLNRLLLSLLDGDFLPGLGLTITCPTELPPILRNRVASVFQDPQNATAIGATPVGYMEPIVLDLQYKRDGQDESEHTLVTLYDFPGEAIWSITNAYAFQQLMLRTSENASGWLLLLDSTTLPAVKNCIKQNDDGALISQPNNAGKPSAQDIMFNAKPSEVLDQFASILGIGNQIKLPVAAIFSKADMIERYRDDFAENYGVDRDMPFMRIPDLGRKAVDVDKLWECDQALQEFLQSTGQGEAIAHARNLCPNHAWFAVSASGAAVRDNKIEAQAAAIRVVDPLEWLLWMVGAFPGIQNEHRDAWTVQEGNA